MGCFKQGDPKAVPELLQDFAGKYKAKYASKVIDACVELTKAKGYTHFGIGENLLTCFSGPDVAKTYQNSGAASKKKCTRSGLGKKGAVVVYKLG